MLEILIVTLGIVLGIMTIVTGNLWIGLCLICYSLKILIQKIEIDLLKNRRS